MANYLLRRVLLLSAWGFLAFAGMVIHAQAVSVADGSTTFISVGEKHLHLASKAKQVLIITFPWFGESPYSETRTILENKGIKILVASSSLDPMPGFEKKLTVKPDVLLSQVLTAEYDAIVFIAAARYEGDNADAVRIAKEGAAEGKVLASYGYAIATLIKAEVLNAKRVAAMSGSFESSAQKAGATISTTTLEQDGRIITASHRSDCQPFAQAIAAALAAGVN
jgi:putative intracellular protease/amidase